MMKEDLNEKEIYRKKIIEMAGRIESTKLLKRIYRLVEYLYVYKEEKE